MKVGSRCLAKNKIKHFYEPRSRCHENLWRTATIHLDACWSMKSGKIVLESQNNYKTDSRLGHAEANLARMAAVQFEEDYLRGCTMYTTVEPCCMCAGTAYWAGLGAVVFGVTEARLGELTGSHPENLTMDLPCRTVFSAGRRPVAVRGPFPELETEILKVHEGFWT